MTILELYAKIKTNDVNGLNELERIVTDKTDPEEMIRALQIGEKNLGSNISRQSSSMLTDKCKDFMKKTMVGITNKQLQERISYGVNLEVIKLLKDKKISLRDW
jgi:DNA phosphorothioation-dependent restriction protein DptG